MSNTASRISFTCFDSSASVYTVEYDGEDYFDSYPASTVLHDDAKTGVISDQAMKFIRQVISYKDLPENWNGYNSVPASDIAISNAIQFITLLDNQGIEIYYTAPSPSGDILIEIRSDACRLEFEFYSDGSGAIFGFHNAELLWESSWNETTEMCSLKWLFCPNGNSPNWE